MKNKTVIIIAALCVMIMGACFSPWDGSGDQGNIVINVGNGGELTQRAVPGATEYTIILTTSGETSISKTTTGGAVDFSVPPGPWNILVRARGWSEASGKMELKGYGEKDAEVKAGAKTDVTVIVNAPESGVTEVASAWTDLRNVLEGTTTPGESEVVLITRNLQVNNYIELGIGKNITLLAKDHVTITKGNDTQNSLFRVPGGSSLTLGTDQRMSGTITINGDHKNGNSLIYVGTNRLRSTTSDSSVPTLTMYEGVTLTNNHANASDRGGGVTVEGGTFNMRGGTISGNSSAANGGGVYVDSKGTFTKTIGTIYGNTGDSNGNRAAGNKGHAVYFEDSRPDMDRTAGPQNTFSGSLWG